jgi:hypothetical protein
MYMTQSTLPTIRTFDIEATGAGCGRCECAYFQRTLVDLREGFCPHTAAAIMGCLANGSFEI